MNNNTTKEGVVNNSNQPSQKNKLQELINNKISQLTEELGKIGNEINELKTIEVSDENQKMIVGSTEFNIEDFMSEVDVEKYRKWLSLKEKWEKKDVDEVRNMIDEEKDDRWYNEWEDEVYNHFDSCDIDVWDYMSERDFISGYMDRDSYDIEWVKENFLENHTDKRVLTDIMEYELKHG